MKFDHVDDRLDDYLYGLLSIDEASVVESHCDECQECAAALDEARRLKMMMQALPPAEASSDLVKRTVTGVDETVARRERNWRWASRGVFGAVLAATALLCAFQAYVGVRQPAPYDIRLVGQNEWVRDSYASVRVGVYDRRSGRALEGVPVELAMQWRDDEGDIQQTSLVSFQSDVSLRSPRFLVPDVDATRLIVTAKPQRTKQTLETSVSTRRGWKLMLSTDKPVYQPGQTIHMRILGMRRPALKPVQDVDAVFKLIDPKGNIMFEQHETTSQFGIAATDCALATELIEGDYQLEATIGDVLSTRTVRIEKYVLPKFKVTLTTDHLFYLTGEKVTGKVQASYFFGEPVRGGKVRLNWSLDSGAASLGKKVMRDLELTTGEDGTATFEIPKANTGVGVWRLDATLTDTAGQRQFASRSVNVTETPLQVQLIAEGGTLTPNVPNRIFAYATDAAGNPVEATLQIGMINGPVRTDTSGLGSFEFTPPERDAPSEAGPGVLIAQCTYEPKDARPALATAAKKPVQVVANFAIGGKLDFLVRPNQSVIRAGETLTLSCLGGGVEPVFVDLLLDGQCVLSDSIDIENGQGVSDVDLPLDVMGTVQMVAYRLSADGLPVRRERTLVVLPASELKISAELDRETYRPGERAKLKLKLTDADGKPQPGAISLAAVDEAVFSVLSEAAGVSRVFFLLEQQLLKPVYTIYPWSPWSETSAADVGGRPASDANDAFLSLTSRGMQNRAAVPTLFLPESQATPPYDTADVEVSNWAEGDEIGNASPFTMSGSSYAINRQEVERWREESRLFMESAWIWLILVAVTSVILLFLVFARTWVAALSWFCAIILPGGILAVVIFVSLLNKDSANTTFGMMFAEGTEMEAMPADSINAPREGKDRPRTRRHFPETLYWRPELVTNDAGIAEIELPLADSITTWRLSTSAVTSAGGLGSSQHAIRVFQPFFVDLNLPVALTRHDEITTPIVVYNYLKTPQQVTLQIDDADWYERTSDEEEALTVQLEPGEVRSVGLPIRVLRAGRHKLHAVAQGVDADGKTVSDAVEREIEVVPNGRKVEQVASGSLDGPVELDLTLPEGVVPDSAKAFVKLYPSSFSQLVEGLDNIFKMPYGCFEQTSSTTYPNVLALTYLRENRLNYPAVEAKARSYIHLGYQRLLTFEVAGGGFDWYGSPPAKLTLTAYGLMEFVDMAKVHNVDPALIARTRQWLMSRRKSDGSWPRPEREFGTIGRANEGGLATTAYIAWSVFSVDRERSDATLEYLLQHEPASLKDPYELALVIHAIHAIQPDHTALSEYVQRLESLANRDAPNKHASWTFADDQDTLFYGSGEAGRCEATALAALALMKAKGSPSLVRESLNWLVSAKDPSGTWHSTQATVLALKALTAVTTQGEASKRLRQVELQWNGESLQPMKITPDQSNVMQFRDLTADLSTGDNRLVLTESSQSGIAYQVIFRYYVDTDEETPDPAEPKPEPLSIDIAYERTNAKVGEPVKAVATITNHMEQAAPMVMVDLPVPGGFRAAREPLQELLDKGVVAKFDITPRQIILYLDGLKPGQSIKIPYSLEPLLPGDVTAPAGRVYEYYDPDVQGTSKPGRLTVEA